MSNLFHSNSRELPVFPGNYQYFPGITSISRRPGKYEYFPPFCQPWIKAITISILMLSHNLARSFGYHRWLCNSLFSICLVSAALDQLAKYIPVYSLLLSSHLFFYLPLLLFYSLCLVVLPLQNQKTSRNDLTTLVFVSWPQSSWIRVHIAVLSWNICQEVLLQASHHSFVSLNDLDLALT